MPDKKQEVEVLTPEVVNQEESQGSPVPAVKKYNPPTLRQMEKGLEEMRRFHSLILKEMVPEIDYGPAYPNSDKKTLLKPGAEKIFRLFGCVVEFDFETKHEDMEKGLFFYNIRAQAKHLKSGEILAYGHGSANTKEKKYISQGAYSVSNTVLKIAEKRAMVDCALRLSSLSELFTQDFENEDDNIPPVSEMPEIELQLRDALNDCWKDCDNINLKQRQELMTRVFGMSFNEVLKQDPIWIWEKMDQLNAEKIGLLGSNEPISGVQRAQIERYVHKKQISREELDKLVKIIGAKNLEEIPASDFDKFKSMIDARIIELDVGKKPEGKKKGGLFDEETEEFTWGGDND